MVFGEVDDLRIAVSRWEWRARGEGMRAKIGRRSGPSLAELALLLPVQIIDPEIHRLIEEGPSRRRRFLDWGVFHVEPSFVDDWQRYQQALKQRNAALKARQPRAAITAWDGDVIRYGEALSTARARYVQSLTEAAVGATHRLLGMELEISYRQGWTRGMSFSGGLDSKLDCGFRRRRYPGWAAPRRTRHPAQRVERQGPYLAGATETVGRGVIDGSGKAVPQDSPVRPSLLLDDPAAELDDRRLTGLIEEVSSQSVQLIVTTLHPEFSSLVPPGGNTALRMGTSAPLRRIAHCVPRETYP